MGGTDIYKKEDYKKEIEDYWIEYKKVWEKLNNSHITPFSVVPHCLGWICLACGSVNSPNNTTCPVCTSNAVW